MRTCQKLSQAVSNDAETQTPELSSHSGSEVSWESIVDYLSFLKGSINTIYEHLIVISNKVEFITKALEVYISCSKQPFVLHEDVRKIVAEILQVQGNMAQDAYPAIPIS